MFSGLLVMRLRELCSILTFTFFFGILTLTFRFMNKLGFCFMPFFYTWKEDLILPSDFYLNSTIGWYLVWPFSNYVEGRYLSSEHIVIVTLVFSISWMRNFQVKKWLSDHWLVTNQSLLMTYLSLIDHLLALIDCWLITYWHLFILIGHLLLLISYCALINTYFD